MEKIEENNQAQPMPAEDSAISDSRYQQLAKLLEVTFTKDEVEDFYAKFDTNPFSNISAA